MCRDIETEFLTRVYRTTADLVTALNRGLDRNLYPTESARRSSMRHRNIAIGVQGLADVFHGLMMPFTSAAAAVLNRRIFAYMYYAALRRSCDLVASGEYEAYSTFAGSPLAAGWLQPDLWDWDAAVRTAQFDKSNCAGEPVCANKSNCADKSNCAGEPVAPEPCRTRGSSETT